MGVSIDLHALRLEAERDDGTDCVVSRRWLKRVLQELTDKRAVADPPALDLDLPRRESLTVGGR